MDIGDKIKSRRNELGFTLEEVADKLGVRDAPVLSCKIFLSFTLLLGGKQRNIFCRFRQR